MRITHQLLRSKAAGPLQSTEYLDLSNLGIVSIEKLQCCPKLQALNLRGNTIVELANLDHNRNLWRLDVSNNEMPSHMVAMVPDPDLNYLQIMLNRIKDLDCLTRFVALGTLNLANNDLTWQEIAKLRHMHILELSLHGNKKLERDPYYRIHVIDCLPNVWMLDGRVVTSAERLQIKHFFADSALTDHPIRRKLSKEWFVPSALKKIEVNGVYGEKATHLMTRFPSNAPCNVDVDKRRLKYLAHNAQEDLTLEKKYTKRDFQVLKYRKTFVEDILDVRPGDRERCNMLLLMLVATLEFVMPTHLVKETLETAKLSKVGKVYAMDLFLLPKDIRCRLVCILLGAVKIDKDSKEDGGLYDKLYLCLFYTVAELSKLSNSIYDKNKVPKTKMTQLYRDYKCLLASEVVQLLCIVPAFFEYVDKDIGVMNLLVTATGDPMVTEKIGKLSENIHNSGGDVKKLYEELSDFLLQKVQEQSLNLSNKSQKLPQEDQVITTMKAIPMKSPRSPIDAADFHARGISTPYTDPTSVLSSRLAAEKSKKHFPHLGDYLLLGPQTLGKIIGLPQPFVAHVAMDSIPVANGAMESKLRQSEDHYTYVNMDQFSWDVELSFWKPRGSIGDRFTIHTIEDLRKELNRRANVTSDHVPRPNSPEDSRSFAVTPGRDVATPLIFSSGGLHSVSDDYMSRRPQYQQNEFSPRPMTSLLKEKLDLKLDLSSQPRAQSASAVETTSRSSYSQNSLRNSPEGKPPPAESKVNVPVEGDNSTSPEKVSADCVQCAMAAESQDGDDPSKPKTHNHEQTEKPAENQEPAKTEETAVAQEGPPTSAEPKDTKESNKENEAPATSRTDVDSLAHSDDEPELQNLTTSRTDHPSVPNTQRGIDQRPGQGDMPRNKSNSSSLQINIPQVELVDAEHMEESQKVKGKVPVIKGRQPVLSSRSFVRPGKFGLQGGNRPFSAMDAYRYIVNHPRKPIGTENIYNTSYQQQRTEAWRQSASTTATSTSHTHFEVYKRSDDTESVTSSMTSFVYTDYGSDSLETVEMLSLPEKYSRQGTPPPQRPTSPDNKTRPNSSLSIKKANDWLGGGRDLYWEQLQKRPRSGHVPGWKEGLPEAMKRPRSAVAHRTMNRQPKRATPITPSSLAYEAMMQGGRGFSPRSTLDNHIPDMMDLAEYQPLYHHLGLPRRLGSSVSSTPQDFSAQPSHDTVYRIPPSSPTQNKNLVAPSYRPSSYCMQCIYEDSIDGNHSQHGRDIQETQSQHSAA